MTEAEIGGILRDALMVALKLAGPPLLVSLVVGVFMAMLQAITQVNESAVAFVPKAVSLFAALALLGPFYYATLHHYAHFLFDRMMTLGWQ